MQQITTFLMFTGNAAEAMNYYIGLFDDSAIVDRKLYGADEGGVPGTVKHATFRLAGQEFMCIDTSPVHAFSFTPSMSLYIRCSTEEQIAERYEKLSAGGKVLMPLGAYPFSKKYGWVTDQFGVSWQLSLE